VTSTCYSVIACVWMMCRLHRNTGKGILPTYLAHRCRRRQDRTQPLWTPARLRNPFDILPFHDRLAPQLNAILPPALPTGAHVRNLTRFDYNFLYVWLWCVDETLVSNHVWPLLLLICFFFWNSFSRTSSTSPSRKNEPVPYDRLQTLGNQSGTFRQKNIDLLTFW